MILQISSTIDESNKVLEEVIVAGSLSLCQACFSVFWRDAKFLGISGIEFLITAIISTISNMINAVQVDNNTLQEFEM